MRDFHVDVARNTNASDVCEKIYLLNYLLTYISKRYQRVTLLWNINRKSYIIYGTVTRVIEDDLE